MEPEPKPVTLTIVVSLKSQVYMVPSFQPFKEERREGGRERRRERRKRGRERRRERGRERRERWPHNMCIQWTCSHIPAVE